MIASRVWYVISGLVVGALLFALFAGASMYDRAQRRSMTEGLYGDAQVVSWFMKDDARKRSSALIQFALDAELGAALSKASADGAKLPGDAREKAKKVLRAVDEKLPPELKFSALFAVDQYGRVVAQHGFDQVAGNEDFELGGYPIVADALHGWIRDDAWVLDGRIYSVVARPVEVDPSQPPAGAIVGARILDDSYARELSKRTGAAVAFYANSQRVSAAAPEGFDAAQLDAITSDVGTIGEDKNYKEKGRSDARILRGNLGVVYSRIPGEAWVLGGGFAVGRYVTLVESPMGFFQKSDDTDKKAVSLPIVVGAAALIAALGLLFSLLEHTKPLRTFRLEVAKFAKGEVEALAPSKFFGAFRKIAADVNDGVEKQVAKGGGTRKAADLEQVLGPIPAQPAMSAFSIPDAVPSAPVELPSMSLGGPPPPRKPLPPKPRPSAPIAEPAATTEEEGEATVVSQIPKDVLQLATGEHKALDDETAEWPSVFEQFVALKQQQGEPTAGLTFEKFRTTLQKNRDAIVQRHGVSKVRFTVYVKDGKAALKASPIKD